MPLWQRELLCMIFIGIEIKGDVMFSDEQLIAEIREDNEEALVQLVIKYKPIVKNISNMYFFQGADKDDVIQEGMIGLIKAINNFREDREAKFATFATLCIKRQIMSAVKAYGRDKHKPLNNYVSIYVDTDESEGSVLEYRDESPQPDQILVDKETVARIEKETLKLLSPFEQKVFLSYIIGKNYVTISKELNKEPKAIDNALGRIKKKLEKILINSL